MSEWSYYSYEGSPVRVKRQQGEPVAAEIYVPGTGFMDGPLTTVLSEARPISKSDFDALIMKLIRKP